MQDNSLQGQLVPGKSPRSAAPLLYPYSGSLAGVSRASTGKHLKPTRFLLISLLTLGAILVHGYHPFCEDAEIYLPGVLKILHPQMFPVGAEFFASHAHLTWFPNLIALSVRVTHLPFDWALLLWHVLSVFLFLLGCYELMRQCFPGAAADWAGVALVAALLTLPVAGTALYILDQYLNPRNLAAFAAVFALARVFERKYWRAGGWLAFGAVLHPLMSAFAMSLAVLLVVLDRGIDQELLRIARGGFRSPATALALLLPFGLSFDPPSQAYLEAMRYHTFHMLGNWAWYEWLGIVAPIPVLLWLASLARRRDLANVNLLCRALVIYDLVYFAAALVIQLPARFEYLARFQPLRSLHLLYILLFLLIGGFLGESWLKNRVWRWLVLFVPLCAGMFWAQRQLFPASQHLELPGIQPRNEWAQAFQWIRRETSLDAVFALDPDHMNLPGEDQHGFRAMAERSMLADAVKDSGAVSMFPPLADHWLEEVNAQRNWDKLQLQDFQQLQSKYGVNWIVVRVPGAPGLQCPFGNAQVRVCRLL